MTCIICDKRGLTGRDSSEYRILGMDIEYCEEHVFAVLDEILPVGSRVDPDRVEEIRVD